MYSIINHNYSSNSKPTLLVTNYPDPQKTHACPFYSSHKLSGHQPHQTTNHYTLCTSGVTTNHEEFVIGSKCSHVLLITDCVPPMTTVNHNTPQLSAVHDIRTQTHNQRPHACGYRRHVKVVLVI